VTISRRIDIPAMVSVIIIGGFFVAFFMNPADQTFRGAIVTAFAAAWGFWLGSSRGAHENREHLNAHQDRLIEAVSGKHEDRRA
jgi:hypothetical protein